MAEFAEVCKQWKRLCQSQESEDQKCAHCSVGDYRMCGFEISDIQEEEIRGMEDAVMAWAAEHPEPVYPTWYRWLTMMGAVASSDDLWIDLQQPIPADIAEKLAIKPKEGI